MLGVPLVRLDFGALYTKWHGETEQNLRDSLKSAEALAPCVLWIDEIEKALSTGDGDSGTSRRVLGAFLTWLAEQRARVFIVATANDITALPPELVRKGRFDEIFFVDLPSPAARVEIFGIHCKKRSIALSDGDIQALAARSEGFSGAEIEQAVVSALYSAHSNKTERGRAADCRRAGGHTAAVGGHGREDRRAARLGRRAYRPGRRGSCAFSQWRDAFEDIDLEPQLLRQGP